MPIEQNGFLQKCICLFPYICSFLNATDLIRSRSVCCSWKNVYQYATYWIQIRCIPSSLLTQIIAEMKELIYCDVDVVSEGKSWDLIIRSHQKLTYLKVRHSKKKNWDGGKCQIGPMPKLHTLEIHDADRVDFFCSQFDSVTLKTPNLNKLRVYNLFFPDYCIPSSISQLTMKTNRLVDICSSSQNYNLDHCTKLSYLCWVSSFFRNQRLEILSNSIQFIHCNCLNNIWFYCPNLKWLSIEKGMVTLPSAAFMEIFVQSNPQLKKVFLTQDCAYKLLALFETWTKKHGIEFEKVCAMEHFELAVIKKLCEFV